MVKKSQKDTDSKQSQYNGFIIVNLAKDISSVETNDLFDLAKKKSVPQLSNLLDKYRSKVTIKPLITSLPPSKTLELERKNTTETSLASFWKIDSRNLSGEQADDLV